jgi:hypothetical protein
MPLFRMRNRRVGRIVPQEHRIREDAIHHLIEGNLSTFFEDLLLVARKPRIGGKEFDTLALSRTTKAPVIIEYKREKDRGVVEQVDLYYVKLKHNKSDVLILLQKQNAVDDLGSVDFENPQIVVIAKEFTPEQREILTLKRGYLRLFRYQLYADGIISVEEVEPLGVTSTIGTRPREVRRASEGPYDIQHFGMRPEVEKLYERLDKGIIHLDSRVKPGKINKYFIGYGATGSYFCSLKPRVHSVRIEVKSVRRPPATRNLPVRKIPDYQHTPMTHFLDVNSSSQVQAALRVIKVALEDSL